MSSHQPEDTTDDTQPNNLEQIDQLDAPADGESKSQRKREADRITQLGKTISELGEPDIRKLGLDDDVLDAVMALRKINSRGAGKRQRLYLGKLLRSRDLNPIEAALQTLQQSANNATRQFHELEQWRDRLINDGNTALSAFIQQYPESDRQRLRQLIRNARQETEQNKPPKFSRELFRLLRETVL